MVAVLYVMGVSSVKEFAAPLMVGILCGAYSSVCITGSLWLTMKGHWRKAKVQPVAATVSNASTSKNATAKKPSKQEPPKADPTQPKKKNRKRVQERLAAQEAAKNAQDGNKNE